MASRSRTWRTEEPVLKTGRVWRAGCIERCTSGSEGGGWISNTARCSGTGRLPYSGERLLALPPGRWDEAALCDWLAAFIGKGSSIDVPVREMPRYYQQLKAPTGKTDLLFLTDARCRLPDEVRERFLTWKRQAQARLTTLVIGGEPGDLALVSDSCHSVPALSPAEDAVGEALSF
jgi:hypothetical protein